MTLCYFLGDDVQKSHLQFIPKWEFTNGIDMSGLHTYVNELTLGANKLLGLQNYQFAWKGPYARLDKEKRYPDRLKEDTKRVAHLGCDAVVFMVFNDFSSGQDQVGHKYSGFAGTTYNISNGVFTSQQARKLKKVQAKKLVKSNKSKIFFS